MSNENNYIVYFVYKDYETENEEIVYIGSGRPKKVI